MTPTGTVHRRKPRRRGLLLRRGASTGPLFVTVFLIEGARRADYTPIRHPVSSLSLGRQGWVQVANLAKGPLQMNSNWPRCRWERLSDTSETR
jgi:hypothetical protein